MSLTNPNKVVTEERLSEFYQGIFPYLGGMPEMVANKFSKGDLYSTDEKMIGQWIDGKPLYQRVFNIGTTKFGTPSWGSGTDIYNALYNTVEYFVNSWALRGDIGSYKACFIPITCWKTASEISATTISTTESIQYIMFQYTKTTDSPIAIGSDTDYSTDEKIIGTWIDGKPLYQKTISCGALPNNTSKTVAHGISNIGQVVNFSAVSHNGNSWICLFDASSSGKQRRAVITANNVQFYTQQDDSLFSQTYVTILYTKTTD